MKLVVTQQLEEWCAGRCQCPGTHWHPEGDRGVWRVGGVGCTHPRHDESGVPVWGIAAADLEDPVVRALSGARVWFWCVVRDGRLAEHGWQDTARWAHQVADGVAHGMDRGSPRRDVRTVRCDLVAAEGWRHLAGLERGRVAGVVPDAA
jgi:hypothetical protein